MKNKHLKLLCLTGAICSICGGLLSSCKKNPTSENVISVHFWHTFGKNNLESVEEKTKSFKKLVKENENVDVEIVLEYQGGYDDIRNKITKSFSTGNTPTLAVAYPDHVADYLSLEKGDERYVINLNDYANNTEYGYTSQKDAYLNTKGEDDFIKSFINEGKVYIKEGTYSLPFMKSSEIMFFNKDLVQKLLKAYGINETPNQYLNRITWDEFMDLLKFANKDLKSHGSLLEVPLIYDDDANLFITNAYQNDNPYVSLNNGKGSCDFNNSKTKEMVKKLKEQYDLGLFATKGTTGEYGSNKFTESKCLFSIGSSGGAAFNDPGNASFSVEACKIPSFNKNKDYFISQGPTLTLLNNRGLKKEVNDKRALYGWKFMKYLTNPEINFDICSRSNGYLPVRKSAYELEEFKDFISGADEDFIPKCCKVVHENIKDRFLYYPVFKGTAQARKSVASILTQVFLYGDANNNLDNYIDKIFNSEENHTKLAM
ncbi:MAG: extracellular solute-binding protein [Bacillales bacterium]